MRVLKKFSLITISLVIAGCQLGPSSVLDPKRPTHAEIHDKVMKESGKVAEHQKNVIKDLERISPKEIQVEPIMPKYDPLEDHIVSFSMIEEDLKLVLYSLAQSVGMNLIMDPTLGSKKNKLSITLNFKNVSAATVLREILKTYDLYYEIKQNVITIKPYEERFYKLNFIDMNVDMAFDVGGDVLGAAETNSTGGLSGNFKLTGKGAKRGNPYDVVEKMVQRLISPEGKYSLNRLSGSLYVKDRPAGIRAVSKMINHLREMLSRQILIEARIIEVSLSDGYSYGIDWSALRQDPAIKNARLDSASWSLGEGLILSGLRKAFSLSATVDALRTFGEVRIVSNPSIRSKHGLPAIISVGTSISYKKSVTTTTSTSSTETQDTTDVEVSTVFDGLILGIVPFIEEDGKITLLINPIKSDVDPSSIEPVQVTSGSADSISLPVVRIKEISTTIGLNSGDIIFLGGLIDKSYEIADKGVPFLSSIPLLGYFFKNESKKDETRELVIVLSVSVG